MTISICQTESWTIFLFFGSIVFLAVGILFMLCTCMTSSTIRETQPNFDEWKRKHEALSKKHKDLEEKYQALEQRCEALKNESLDLESKNEELEETVNAWRQKYEDLEAENEYLEEMSDVWQRRYEDLEAEKYEDLKEDFYAHGHHEAMWLYYRANGYFEKLLGTTHSKMSELQNILLNLQSKGAISAKELTPAISLVGQQVALTKIIDREQLDEWIRGLLARWDIRYNGTLLQLMEEENLREAADAIHDMTDAEFQWFVGRMTVFLEREGLKPNRPDKKE